MLLPHPAHRASDHARPYSDYISVLPQIGGKRIIARLDPKTQTRTEIASVPVDHALSPPWIHDLPGSENYILVPDTPVVMDLGVKVHLFQQHLQEQVVWHACMRFTCPEAALILRNGTPSMCSLFVSWIPQAEERGASADNDFVKKMTRPFYLAM